jgi:FkbM family methyltransferase
MRLRSLITGPLTWALPKSGRNVTGRDRYGFDPFLDIDRLSQFWKYPVRVLFDVGANDGRTIRLARNRFPTCQVVAFEPHPRTFLRLKEKMQGFEDLEFINMALGSKSAEMGMFEYDKSVLNSLLLDPPYAVRFSTKPSQQIRVRCTTVDEFCMENGIAQIDVLKIDTEGFDLEVLKGAKAILEKNAIKFIYFEFNDIEPQRDSSGGALAPIHRFIRPYGYRFISTYNDYIVTQGDLFMVSNALYALPPAQSLT